MQVTTELNPLFSYSLIPILILLIIIAIILFIYILTSPKNKEIIIPIKVPDKEDINTIKNKYLKEINKLIKKVETNSINNRLAYQELSLIIRNFVYEMTNIKVQTYTLQDIRYLNMPYLYELVQEYYNPEFAFNSSGNILNSINKTKGVIEKWN